MFKKSLEESRTNLRTVQEHILFMKILYSLNIIEKSRTHLRTVQEYQSQHGIQKSH